MRIELSLTKRQQARKTTFKKSWAKSTFRKGGAKSVATVSVATTKAYCLDAYRDG